MPDRDLRWPVPALASGPRHQLRRSVTAPDALARAAGVLDSDPSRRRDRETVVAGNRGGLPMSTSLRSPSSTAMSARTRFALVQLRGRGASRGFRKARIRCEGRTSRRPPRMGRERLCDLVSDPLGSNVCVIREVDDHAGIRAEHARNER